MFFYLRYTSVFSTFCVRIIFLLLKNNPPDNICCLAGYFYVLLLCFRIGALLLDAHLFNNSLANKVNGDNQEGECHDGNPVTKRQRHRSKHLTAHLDDDDLNGSYCRHHQNKIVVLDNVLEQVHAFSSGIQRVPDNRHNEGGEHKGSHDVHIGATN